MLLFTLFAKALFVTVVLMAASLVFAEEAALSALILTTTYIAAVRITLGLGSKAPPGRRGRR